MTPRVDAAPNGMETPTLLSDCVVAWVKRHSGRIRSHPWVRNPSIRLQLGRTGNENGSPPGRYRSARCGNPKLGDYHLNMEQFVAEFSAYRVRDPVRQRCSVETWFSKQQKGVRGSSDTRGGQETEILSYIYNSIEPETKTVTPRVDTTPHGVETLT